MAKYGLSKKDTRKKLLYPLEKTFGCKIFFNGEQSERMKLASNFKGCCYVNERAIVIRWQRDFARTLSTLFHEIGHLRLHADVNSTRSKFYFEVEAEAVARYTFEYAGFPAKLCTQLFYQENCYMRNMYECYKVVQYYKSSERYTGNLELYVPPDIRWERVEKVAKQIVSAFDSLAETVEIGLYTRDGIRFELGEQLSLIDVYGDKCCYREDDDLPF